MWKRLFFNRFHQQKTRKRSLTIFLNLWVCSLPSTLHHFEGTKNFHFLQLLHLLRLSLFQTTLCFFYLDIRTHVECRTVLSFNRVTSSSLMTLTYLLFFIATTPTSPLLFSPSPYFAPGRCFRTCVLITYQFY